MTRFIKWSKQNWLVWAVLLAYIVTALSKPAAAVRALVLGAETFASLIVTLVTVFVVVGLFLVWVNDEFIMKHLGEESGFIGLVLGASFGTVLHGPLIGVFPLLRALIEKGARVGVVIAIVSTWAIKLPMIPLEIRLFGWKFALLRNGLLFVSAFIMAPLMELVLGKEWIDDYRKSESDEFSLE
ncbi:MAG: permease [Coriobacteriia bacterium]|nr:permease [Coriobacteriia bacterium]